MPSYVTTIDLDAPLEPIALAPQHDGLFALLRQGGRPAGLLRLSGSGLISVGQLTQALEKQQRGPDRQQRNLMGAASAKISIIVCTHERPADLERCLAALAPAAAQGHEIIVVDNAPRSARTAEVAARFPYRYMVEPRQGLDHARNCGLRAAAHPIVAYTDDDAAPDPQWASAIAAPFADPQVGCTTGLVLPLELESAAQEQFEVYCSGRRSFTRQTFAAPATPPSTAGVAGMGANMALRRELALGIGGFDPRLDGGQPTRSGGDTDMYARVLDAGASIVYTPDALVWHRHRRELAELHSCIFGYGVGLYSFLTKRLIEQGDSYALLTAARWWAGPLVKAAWHRLRGRETAPLKLLLLEAAGAFYGPLSYRQADRLLTSVTQGTQA
jgi:GT2 family glycosyltransferase